MRRRTVPARIPACPCPSILFVGPKRPVQSADQRPDRHYDIHQVALRALIELRVVSLFECEASIVRIAPERQMPAAHAKDTDMDFITLTTHRSFPLPFDWFTPACASWRLLTTFRCRSASSLAEWEVTPWTGPFWVRAETLPSWATVSGSVRCRRFLVSISRGVLGSPVSAPSIS